MNPLRDDGERFLPGQMSGVIALEHLHRYLFALQFADQRVVLDIASGEGYGSALLSTRASHVTGVDIDAAAVEHARSIYAGERVVFEVGDCAKIPLAESSVDLVVSFETLEHHGQHEQMMAEARRVLRPEGLLVISTPDRLEYSEKPAFANPFHVKELYVDEFEHLLRSQFKHVTLLRQRVMAGSWLLHDDANSMLSFFRAGEGPREATRMPAAPYIVAVASNRKLPAIHGGVLHEELGRLAAPMLRDTTLQITRLLKLIAIPSSRVLRQHLDSDWYLQHNVDLASPDFNRYDHWINNGADEGRVPSSDPATLARELLAEHADIASDARAASAQRITELTEQLANLARQQQDERAASTHSSEERERALREEADARLLSLQRQHEENTAAWFRESATERSKRDDLLTSTLQELAAARETAAAGEAWRATAEQRERDLITRLAAESTRFAATLLERETGAVAREQQLRDDLTAQFLLRERELGEVIDALRLRLQEERAAAAAALQASNALHVEREHKWTERLSQVLAEAASARAESERALAQHFDSWQHQVDADRRKDSEQANKRESGLRAALAEQSEQIAASEREHARRVRDLVQDSALQIDHLRGEMAHREDLLQEERLELQRSVQGAFTRLVTLTEAAASERALLRAELAELALRSETRISAIEASVSWRLTAPLRKLGSLWRGESRRLPPSDGSGAGR